MAGIHSDSLKPLLLALPFLILLVGWGMRRGRFPFGPAATLSALAALLIVFALPNRTHSQSQPAGIELIIVDPAAALATEDPESPSFEFQETVRQGLQVNDRLRWVTREANGWKVQNLVPAGEMRRIAQLEEIFLHHTPDYLPRWLMLGEKKPVDFQWPHNVTAAVYSLPMPTDPIRELAQLRLPERVHAGRPFAVKWKWRGVSPGDKQVRLWVDGEEQENLETITLQEPGIHEIRLESAQRMRGRKQSVVGYVEVLPPPVVGFSPPNPVYQKFLEGQGFETASTVEEADKPLSVLVFSGPPRDAAKIGPFVREGGGCLFFARECFVGAPEEALRELLPLQFSPRENVTAKPPAPESEQTSQQEPSGEQTPEPQLPSSEEIQNPRSETRESGQVALALVLDKSGSMAGQKMQRAREAVLATAGTLHHDDYLAVYAFNREVEEIVPSQTIKNIPLLPNLLARIRPGGGTRLFPALRRAAIALEQTPASLHHLIILTDGATEDANAIEAPYKELLTGLVNRGVTTSIVAIRGGDFDTIFLSTLAVWGGGGENFFPVDTDRVPEIFTLEASRMRQELDSLQEKESPPKKPDTPSEELPPTRAPESDTKKSYTPIRFHPHPVLRGIDLARAPKLGGYLGSRPRLGAAVPLMIRETEEPLLAIRHWGLGKVALWTSDGTGDWTRDWAQDPRASKLFVQLIEYLRPADPRGSGWHLQVESGRVRCSFPPGETMDPMLTHLFPDVPARTQEEWEAADEKSWGSGESRPLGGGMRLWTLGALPEKRTDAWDQEILHSTQQLQDFLVRKESGPIGEGSPWLALFAGLLLVAEAFTVFGGGLLLRSKNP